ncbi:oxidation resistance protein 1 [Cinnamomum micranthum f. kanehirae]|uniref:Oxidation resistance protein 1 n=1 Tax=Cinnamomum micranthum f. kanehirae TaxID=337451 RepID=A0A3S3MJK5_9MAGN|nr:oxidation resistance protein 1 [Cinnamomum micranthum f. kanehirae]
MLSWKERVSDKISRLLSDSPLSPSSDSPVSQPDPQALPPISKEEELARPVSDSFSSLIYSLRPTTSSGLDGYKTNKQNSRHDTSPLSLRSSPSLLLSSPSSFLSSPSSLLSSRWKIIHSRWKDRSQGSSVECGLENSGYESLEVCEEDVDHVSERNISFSDNVEETPKIEETSTSDDVVKSIPDLMDESSFISSDLFEFLHSSLPNIVKGCQWVLLYSTLKHGISLRTLLRKSCDISGPCLLIVGDREGAVFGGLLECPLKPTTKRKYQGTSQTFVFTTIYGEPRLFRATGANRFYYLCLDDLLALGGGGSFALYLDGDLLHGTSGPSETFGNMCLAHKPEFELKNVELWGFTHSTRYLF